jgi:hypothetical protein
VCPGALRVPNLVTMWLFDNLKQDEPGCAMTGLAGCRLAENTERSFSSKNLRRGVIQRTKSLFMTILPVTRLFGRLCREFMSKSLILRRRGRGYHLARG